MDRMVAGPSFEAVEAVSGRSSAIVVFPVVRLRLSARESTSLWWLSLGTYLATTGGLDLSSG